MNTILLKQVAITGGYEFHGEDSGTNFSYHLQSTSSILTVLDRFIGMMIGIPISIKVSESNSKNEALLKKKCGFLFERYNFFEKNKWIASINRGKNLFKPEIFVHSIYGDFMIQSMIMTRTFTIIKEGTVVASIKKITFSFKDAYEISNFDIENQLFLLAIAFSLDNMFHA